MTKGSGDATILLVEDNPGDVRLTKEALKGAPTAFHLEVATDGEDALNVLYKREGREDSPRPDLILLDLNLPRLDGREVLEEIKSDPKLRSTPVVVLTTSEAREDIEQAYEAGANCYVTKPVDLDDFLYVIQTIEAFWFRTAELPA